MSPPEQPQVPQLIARLGNAFRAERIYWLAFALCAVLASLAVWAHPFPPGIDLPQHANLFQLMVDYRRPDFGYRHFYALQFFTPYVVSYGLGVTFTVVGGPVFAAKLCIWLAAMTTPLALRSWLRALRGEVWWSLFGFVLTFGFGYQWGFLSFVMAFPVTFFYFAKLEQAIQKPSLRGQLSVAVLLAVLFFSHGITFGVAAVAGGIRCLWNAEHRLATLRSIVGNALHLIPSAALAIGWLVAGSKHTAQASSEWPPSTDRFVSLFSGWWSSFPAYIPAVAAIAFLTGLLVLARPTFRPTAAHALPLLLGVLAFVALPEWVSSTWLVGTRMLVLIHAFAPAAFVPRVHGRRRKVMRGFSVAAVVIALVALNHRLFAFDKETEGLREIAALVPEGSNVRTLMVDTDHQSEPFGRLMHGQAAAWITALRGGFLENDSAVYFQLPVKRRDQEGWLSQYEYFLARGDSPRGIRQARRFESNVQEVGRKGQWVLFRTTRPEVEFPGMRVVRSSQQWGQLHVDQTVTGKPLSVGGTPFDRGLGTHARSRIHVRMTQPASRIEGLVGLDDHAEEPGVAVFRVLKHDGTVLYDSGPMQRGEAARPFSVETGGSSDFVLRVDTTTPGNDGIRGAHADWLKLSARP